MTDFAHKKTVLEPQVADITTAVLGADVAGNFKDADLGKLVKAGTDQNYILCATNDDIEGFVVAMEVATVNQGRSYGSVQRRGRHEVNVGPNQVGTLAVGAFVVADTQVALGTAGLGTVRAGAGTNYKWRMIGVLTGTGVAGDKVLIERV